MSVRTVSRVEWPSCTRRFFDTPTALCPPRPCRPLPRPSVLWSSAVHNASAKSDDPTTVQTRRDASRRSGQSSFLLRAVFRSLFFVRGQSRRHLCLSVGGFPANETASFAFSLRWVAANSLGAVSLKKDSTLGVSASWGWGFGEGGSGGAPINTTPASVSWAPAWRRWPGGGGVLVGHRVGRNNK